MSTGQLPYTISEGRPPLCNTSSEAGAPPSEVCIENNSDRKFSKSKFFQVILETTFVHVSCYPDHYEPKIFLRFSKFTHTLRYTILDSRAPLVMRSRKAGLPFAIRARKRELRLQRYVSRMTRTENLLSQNFSKFFWKLLLFMFHATLIIMSRKYFFGFQRSHIRFDTRFWTRGLPL